MAARKKPTGPKLGECCPVLKLVLERDVATGAAPRGFEVAPFFSLEGKGTGVQLIYRFRKAKRTDVGEYGHGTKFADAAYAKVTHCPFCGAKTERDDAEG